MRLMHLMSRQVRAGLVLAAACLLAACQTLDMPLATESLQYGPAPISTLVSRRDLQFKLAQVERENGRMAVLAYQPPGERPLPVAVMSLSRSGNESYVSVSRLAPLKAQEDQGNIAIVTTEYLYALVMRQDPEALYCLTQSTQQCNVSSNGYSHAELLRELAREHQEDVARVGRTGTSIPWHVVALKPTGMVHPDSDQVSVHITSDEGSMEGKAIFFNKAPHSSCMANIDKSGIATCYLIDQHGDDGAHSEHEKAPVLATFPGDVGAKRVLLPTTLVQKPEP
jgi:hypothetical protein